MTSVLLLSLCCARCLNSNLTYFSGEFVQSRGITAIATTTYSAVTGRKVSCSVSQFMWTVDFSEVLPKKIFYKNVGTRFSEKLAVVFHLVHAFTNPSPGFRLSIFHCFQTVCVCCSFRGQYSPICKSSDIIWTVGRKGCLVSMLSKHKQARCGHSWPILFLIISSSPVIKPRLPCRLLCLYVCECAPRITFIYVYLSVCASRYHQE